MVMMTSGFHSSTCSIETLARPPRVPPATFCAMSSIVSTLIEPPSLEPARPAGIVDARRHYQCEVLHTRIQRQTEIQKIMPCLGCDSCFTQVPKPLSKNEN